MRDYQMRITTFPLAAVVKKLSFLQPLYSAYLKFVLSSYKSDKGFQPNSAINFTYGGVHRDADFFAYKSFYKNYLIKIRNQTSWIKIDGGFLVGDIEPCEKNMADELIADIKRLARLLGCTKIYFSVGKDTYWDLMLKNKLPCEEKTYIGYLDLSSGLPLENFKYMMADYDTF